MSFAQNKLCWLEEIMDNHELWPICLPVALNITIHWNEERDDSFVGQETIAQRIGISRRAVQKALDQMIDHGHLTFIRSTPNGYRPILRDANRSSHFKPQQKRTGVRNSPCSNANSTPSKCELDP